MYIARPVSCGPWPVCRVWRGAVVLVIVCVCWVRVWCRDPCGPYGRARAACVRVCRVPCGVWRGGGEGAVAVAVAPWGRPLTLCCALVAGLVVRRAGGGPSYIIIHQQNHRVPGIMLGFYPPLPTECL